MSAVGIAYTNHQFSLTLTSLYLSFTYNCYMVLYSSHPVTTLPFNFSLCLSLICCAFALAAQLDIAKE